MAGCSGPCRGNKRSPVQTDANPRHASYMPHSSCHERVLERESCLAQLVELKPSRVNERSVPMERNDAEDDDDDDNEDDEVGGVLSPSMGRNFLVAGTYTLFLETLECA